IPIGPKDKARNPHASDDADAKDDDDKAKWEAEAKEKAEQVHKLATAKNADFEALAREHSSGPSAMKGGDIGIFTEDRMAEEFSKAAFKLKVGEISKPVKTKFGYHIIKVTGKWPAGELPKEALEDQIRDRLRQRKLHQGRRELKEQLLAKHTIVDNIEPTLGPEPKRGGRRMNKGDGKGPRTIGPRNRDASGKPRTVLDKDAAKVPLKGAPPTKPEN